MYLWFSSLPCFDIKDYTAEANEDNAMLKKCYWKSKPISCLAIFSTTPTDAGMCCAFHQAEADKIFHKSEYTRTLKMLQKNEKNESSESGSLPEWYVKQNEPTSQAGTRMGLTVILDAHTDMTTELSITDNFEGFTASIMPPSEFPLMYQRGFEVRSKIRFSFRIK
jgi:hypothetical protein